MNNNFVVNENFKWKKFPIEHEKYVSVFLFDTNTKINDFLNELYLVYPENIKVCDLGNLNDNENIIKNNITVIIDIRKKIIKWDVEQELNTYINSNKHHVIVLMDKDSCCKFLFSLASLVVIDSIDSFNSCYSRSMFNISNEVIQYKKDFVLIIDRVNADSTYSIRV